MAVKLKWRVGEKPTGPYRSFHKRSWPTAWLGEQLVAALDREDGRGYWPNEAETSVLVVRVFDYREGSVGRKSARLKARPVGVKEAKELVQRFYSANPDWLPKD